MPIFKRKQEKTTMFIGLTRAFLAAAVFFIPLFFLPGLNDPLELPKASLFLVLVLLSAASFTLHAVVTGSFHWRKVPGGWFIVAYVAVILLSSIFSIHRASTFYGMTGFVHQTLPILLALPICAVLFVQIFDRERDIHAFSLVLVASLGIAALLGVLQMSGASPIPFSELRTTDFLVTGNSAATFAILMAVLATLALPLLRSARSMLWRTIGYGALVLPTLGLLAVDATAGWIAALVGIVVSFVFASLGKLSRTELGVSAALLAVIVIGLLLPTGGWFGSKIGTDLRLDSRETWAVTKGALSAYPIIGSGPSTFLYDFARFHSASFNTSSSSGLRFMKASDDASQLLVTTGIIGSLALLAIIASVFAAFVRRSEELFRRNKKTWLSFSALFGAWAGILAALFFVPSTFSTFALFWILLGLLLVILRKSDVATQLRESVGRFTGSLGFFLSMACLIVGAVFSVRLLLADHAIVKANAAVRSTQDIDGVISTFDRAIRLNGSNPTAYLLRAQAKVVKAQLLLQSGSAQTSQAQALLSAATADGEAAAQRDPKNPSILETLADLYKTVGSITGGTGNNVLSTYERAVQAEPSSAILHVDLGQVEYFIAAALSSAKKDDPGVNTGAVSARAEFEQALRLQPGNIDAAFGLVLVDELVGEKETAFNRLSELVQSHPESAGLWYEFGMRSVDRNDVKQAKDAFNRAVALQPSFSQAHWQLGLLAEQEKDTATAKKEFELVGQLDPSNTEVQKKLDALPKS